MIGIHDGIIHNSSSANFSGFSYDTLVVGSGNTTVIVNGCSMNLAAGTSFNAKICSISGGNDVYLIGSPLYMYQGGTTLP